MVRVWVIKEYLEDIRRELVDLEGVDDDEVVLAVINIRDLVDIIEKELGV